MADIDHANLTDERLHYPRGASSALAGTVCTSNGDGTTSFVELPNASVVIADRIIASSFSTQYMQNEGDDRTISFGVGGISPQGNIVILPNGSVTFNTTGVYDIGITRNASRESSGGVAEVAFGPRINGSDVGGNSVVSMDNATAGYSTNSASTGLFNAQAGDVLTYHMYYLMSDGGDAGVSPVTIPSAAWSDVPSASISVALLKAE